MRQAYLLSFLLVMACSCRQQKPTEVRFQKPVVITVGIQPFTGFREDLTDSLIIAIQDIYGFKAVILPETNLPVKAYTVVKTPRYRADTLIHYLLDIMPDSVNLILGLTDKDISTTKRDSHGGVKQPGSKYEDWGIFGLANMPGRSCVVSIYRYRNTDYSLLVDRFRKICIHELGHNLGLPHCENAGCVMRDAEETIKSVDSENMNLCTDCKNQTDSYLKTIQ